ncbi:peroxisome- protein [Physocladia obscura]|uniref:Peroxisome- protein n=1 Tax=Physocladia obscura TaxID=109957 RepID=A0AAD5STM2_9FUNG|nr:peroxisome- protein [Physocladia obscura]
MQFIQNQMSLFVKAHDATASLLRSFVAHTTTNPLECLEFVLVSLISSTVAWYVVPTRLILVCAVVGVFAGARPEVWAGGKVVAAWIFRAVTYRIDVVKEGIQAAADSPDGTVVVVEVFENQRWWAGLGWIQHLLRTERSPWSDETGAIPRPHKDVYGLPPSATSIGSWIWQDPEWTLDFDWSPITVDQKEGWQYSDNRWHNCSAKMLAGSTTRRRMWTRRMKFVPGFGVSIVATALVKPKISERFEK